MFLSQQEKQINHELSRRFMHYEFDENLGVIDDEGRVWSPQTDPRAANDLRCRLRVYGWYYSCFERQYGNNLYTAFACILRKGTEEVRGVGHTPSQALIQAALEIIRETS